MTTIAKVDEIMPRSSSTRTDDIDVLVEAIRFVIPPVKNFTSNMIQGKICSERVGKVADELNAYINRDCIISRRIERLNEGKDLLKKLVAQMREAKMPVTCKTVCDCLGWLDNILVTELEDAFPGYSHLMR